MGLQDEIGRQDEDARSHQSAQSDAHAKMLSNCQEFIALVRQHQLPASGPYFKEIGVDFNATGPSSYSFAYAGQYYRVFQDEGTTYALNSHAKPITLSYRRNHRYTVTSRRIDDNLRFDQRTTDLLGSRYRPDLVAVQKDATSPNFVYYLTQERLASAFREMRKNAPKRHSPPPTIDEAYLRRALGQHVVDQMPSSIKKQAMTNPKVINVIEGMVQKNLGPAIDADAKLQAGYLEMFNRKLK